MNHASDYGYSIDGQIPGGSALNPEDDFDYLRSLEWDAQRASNDGFYAEASRLYRRIARILKIKARQLKSF